MKEIDSSTEKNLGTQLRYFRKKLTLGQKEMAEHLGVSLSLYSKLESQQVQTSVRTIGKFSKILHTSVDFLTTGAGEEVVVPSVEPPSAEITKISDECLSRIIELARRDDLKEVAEKLAESMKSSPERAFALMIKTIIMDPKND